MAAPMPAPATPPMIFASVDLLTCEPINVPATAPSTPPTTVAVFAHGSSLTLTPAIDCAPVRGSVAQPGTNSSAGRTAASEERNDGVFVFMIVFIGCGRQPSFNHAKGPAPLVNPGGFPCGPGQ